MAWESSGAWPTQSGGLAITLAASNLLADYTQLAQSCGCQRNGPLLAALIETLASLPATRGYYLADDSQLNLAPPSVLQSWAGRVRALDPNPAHLTMLAHWGMSDPSGLGDYAQYAGIGSLDASEWYPDTGPKGNALSDLAGRHR